MEVDDLFPVAEALQLLRFAEIEGGDIRLTDTGKQFAEGGTDDRKKLFQRQLLAYVPLAAHIRRVLQERANHTAPRSRFRDELEDHMTAESPGRRCSRWSHGRASRKPSLTTPAQKPSVSKTRPDDCPPSIRPISSLAALTQVNPTENRQLMGR